MSNLNAFPVDKKELKKLYVKLAKAYTTCSDCGNTFGVYSAGVSSFWQDTCDVCGQEKSVTEARDFAYFITGQTAIARLLKDN
jgi:uncharacterized protein (DUF983 family)